MHALRKNQNWDSFFSVYKNIHNDGVLRQRGKGGEFTALLQDDLRNTQYIVYIILCVIGNDGPFAKKAFVKHFSACQVLCEALEILLVRLVARNLLPLESYYLVGRSNRGQINRKPPKVHSGGGGYRKETRIFIIEKDTLTLLSLVLKMKR